jgi:hypothetical protein
MAKRKKDAKSWEMSWTATTGERVVIRNGRVTVTGGVPPGQPTMPDKKDPAINPAHRARAGR